MDNGFGTPEYASYLQLCLELNLERKPEDWRDGDWFAYELEDKPGFWPTEIPVTKVTSANIACYRTNPPTSAGERGFYEPANRALWVWIPRLDQWLDQLQASSPIRKMPSDELIEDGEYRWDFVLCQGWRGMWKAELEWSDGNRAYSRIVDPHPTPEEACARLWMDIMDLRSWV